ncbi:hypothetical protein RBSH_00030, partial [Rhodopirellula baltica SH28]
TEGFYDTAVTEAVEFESRTTNDTPARLEVQRKVCPKGLCVKTMLCDGTLRITVADVFRVNPV